MDESVRSLWNKRELEEGIGRNFRVSSRPKRIKTEAAPFQIVTAPFVPFSRSPPLAFFKAWKISGRRQPSSSSAVIFPAGPFRF